MKTLTYLLTQEVESLVGHDTSQQPMGCWRIHRGFEKWSSSGKRSSNLLSNSKRSALGNMCMCDNVYHIYTGNIIPMEQIVFMYLEMYVISIKK